MKLGSDISNSYNRNLFFIAASIGGKAKQCQHLDIKKLLNEELFNMNVHVANINETKTRGRLLNLIFTANMISPF